MFANTGHLSFYLFGAILLITIICIFWIINSKMEIERLDKITDLLKYSIVSIFIASASIIITNLFKEREQEIKELEYFDRYINDVKKADGIEDRLRLSKYLSIVAPSGELKKSWSMYYESVQNDYKEYQDSKALVDKAINDSTRISTPKQEVKIEKAIAVIQNENKPLENVSSTSFNNFSGWMFVGKATEKGGEWDKKGKLTIDKISISSLENGIQTVRIIDDVYLRSGSPDVTGFYSNLPVKKALKNGTIVTSNEIGYTKAIGGGVFVWIYVNE